jgi:membrane-bound inhibitor of C-type lysozyme
MRRLALIALLGLAACQTAPSGPAPKVGLTRNTEAVVSFGCENGVSFTAAFLVSPDAVALHFADGAKRTLPRAVSASGARFADSTHEFWNKGDEAMFTVGKAAPTKCRVAK